MPRDVFILLIFSRFGVLIFLSFFGVWYGFFFVLCMVVVFYSPICWHRMSLSYARQRCLAIKDNMPHRMLLHVDARLYHALGLGYNNAAGICGNLYFTCEGIKGKKRWMSHRKICEKNCPNDGSCQWPRHILRFKAPSPARFCQDRKVPGMSCGLRMFSHTVYMYKF